MPARSKVHTLRERHDQRWSTEREERALLAAFQRHPPDHIAEEEDRCKSKDFRFKVSSCIILQGRCLRVLEVHL